jgi:hypothetical protein
MANHCSGVLFATLDRIDFVHWVVFQRPAPSHEPITICRNRIIDTTGPMTWNELAKSADFYSRHPAAIRQNAIVTLRQTLPMGVV